MFERLEVLRLAQALATHAAIRQRAIAQNVAHADTPGYRARDVVPFARFLELTDRGRQAPPPDPAQMIRPDAAPATRAPDGNTVSLEREMMRAAEVRGQHELALGIYAAVRDLMRATLGRGR
jgi:flagellar basal-body rod protein FlgB